MSTSPAPRAKWSLRRKVLTGGGIAILAAGFWMGTLFQGPGLGTGTGREGSDDASGGTPATVAPDDVSATLGNPTLVRPADGTQPGASDGLPDGTSPQPFPVEEPAKTIAVFVTGAGFGLLQNPPPSVSTLAPPLSQHFQPATLEEIVTQAKAAAGNASGIKVQIVRHKSSTAGGRSSLLTALREAGLPDDALLVDSDFYD